MKKHKKMAFRQWALTYRNELKSLWEDFKADTGSRMTFKRFTHFMYTETIHF